MKIAVSSSGKNLKSLVDLRFGRCPYFLIVDAETDKFEVLENIAGQQRGGAGVTAAQLVVNKGVKAVIAGNFGPRAINALSGSQVDIFQSESITIKKALEKFKSNNLKKIS
jgi:predicted Fe-Mo cluster-binding NifX family protein